MFGFVDMEEVNSEFRPVNNLFWMMYRTVQDLFTNLVGLNQIQRDKPKALSVIFSRNDDDCREKDGRRAAFEMLIFAEYNYVTVATRSLNDTEKGKWEIHSHHDSCWRGDGVESVVRKAFYDGFAFDFMPLHHFGSQKIADGIAIVNMSRADIQVLDEARKKRYNR